VVEERRIPRSDVMAEEPQPKLNLVHFSLKICNLMARILVLFNWGNFSKVVCFSHMRDFP